MPKRHSIKIRIISTIILSAFLATQSGWAMPISDARASHIRAKSAGESNTTTGALANSLGAQPAEARGAGRDRPEFGVGTGPGLVSEPSPVTLTDQDRIKALVLIRAAAKRTGTALLYIGANSPELVLERILESHVLFYQYKNNLFAYLNDLSDEKSEAFYDFLDIIGNNTTSRLMRHGFQLSYFERLIRQRIRAILEKDTEEESILEVLSIGAADGGELMSAAIVIADASRRAVRDVARETVQIGQSEKVVMAKLESRLRRIRFVLRGIDIDSRQAEFAKQKFPDGYGQQDVAITKLRLAAARWNYVNKRMPGVKELIDKGAMRIEFEPMNFLDAAAAKYISNADYVFLNSVLYQLSSDAQAQACRVLSVMKPGAVLFTCDDCIGVVSFDRALLMPQALAVRAIWEENFRVFARSKKTNEKVWIRQGGAVVGSAAVRAAAANGASISLVETVNGIPIVRFENFTKMLKLFAGSGLNGVDLVSVLRQATASDVIFFTGSSDSEDSDNIKAAITTTIPTNNTVAITGETPLSFKIFFSFFILSFKKI